MKKVLLISLLIKRPTNHLSLFLSLFSYLSVRIMWSFSIFFSASVDGMWSARSRGQFLPQIVYDVQGGVSWTADIYPCEWPFCRLRCWGAHRRLCLLSCGQEMRSSRSSLLYSKLNVFVYNAEVMVKLCRVFWRQTSVAKCVQTSTTSHANMFLDWKPTFTDTIYFLYFCYIILFYWHCYYNYYIIFSDFLSVSLLFSMLLIITVIIFIIIF